MSAARDLRIDPKVGDSPLTAQECVEIRLRQAQGLVRTSDLKRGVDSYEEAMRLLEKTASHMYWCDFGAGDRCTCNLDARREFIAKYRGGGK